MGCSLKAVICDLMADHTHTGGMCTGGPGGAGRAVPLTAVFCGSGRAEL